LLAGRPQLADHFEKRDAFLQAYEQFEIDRVAAFSNQKIGELLLNPGIVRNRLKIPAIVNNARLAQGIRKEFGSFSTYIWTFSNGKTIHNHRASQREIPATSAVSDAMSRDMIKGLKFAGSTTGYALCNRSGCERSPWVSKILTDLSHPCFILATFFCCLGCIATHLADICLSWMPPGAPAAFTPFLWLHNTLLYTWYTGTLNNPLIDIGVFDMFLVP
jgi:DNA-3-methyladenine glycosylase I